MLELLTALLFITAGAAKYGDNTATHSIYYVLDDFTVTDNPSSGIAYVEYKDIINSTGWSLLTVRTNASSADRQQARAAGVGEGFVTATRILQMWTNMMSGYCATPSDYCDKLTTYITSNIRWIQDMIYKYSHTSRYWYHMDLIRLQMEGLYTGFNMVYPSRLTLYQFYLMNLYGDLIDLEMALGSHDMTDNKNRTKLGNEKMLEHVLGLGHCSAFIKWLPGDLLTSHNTWNTYQSMIRVIKNYELNFVTGPDSEELMPGSRQVFTSYPGYIFSGDDYTLIGSGIAAQETTIGNFNTELWKFISTKNSVPEYMRSMIANRLAVDGDSWCKTFEKFNSGTYNNQWMIVNYNLFTPGMPSLQPGTLYVLEQLPGTILYADRTEVLNTQKYWPSYNTPYYPEIFNLSGSQVMVDKFGPMFAFDTNPRALIFKRDNHTVTDMETLYKLMRYNDYTNDPFSKCDGCKPPYSAINTIASRSDLNPADGTFPLPILGHMLNGAIDYKGTNYELMKKLGMRVAGGPTWEQQPPFRWSTSDGFNLSHIGIVDLQQFKEVTVVF